MDQTEILRLVASTAGPFIVIAWLIYFTFSRTIPAFHDQMATQRRESATVHARHAESIDKLCDSINALECRRTRAQHLTETP